MVYWKNHIKISLVLLLRPGGSKISLLLSKKVNGLQEKLSNAALSKIGDDLFNNWNRTQFFYWGNGLLNSYFGMKKHEKILSVFDEENWILKYNCGTFGKCCITSIHKIQHFPGTLFIILIKSS